MSTVFKNRAHHFFIYCASFFRAFRNDMQSLSESRFRGTTGKKKSLLQQISFPRSATLWGPLPPASGCTCANALR